MSHGWFKATCAAICLVMVGCASSIRSSQSPNLSGYPPSFRQGYADGCASAHSLFSKKAPDAARAREDVQYAWGWRDGRDICGR